MRQIQNRANSTDTASMFQDDDSTLQDYFLNCLRSHFDLNAQYSQFEGGRIPFEFNTQNFNTRLIQETQDNIDDVKSWNDLEADARADAHFKQLLKDYIERHTRIHDTLRKITSASHFVQDLELDPEFNELRSFMLTDLLDSYLRLSEEVVLRPIAVSGEVYKIELLEALEAKLIKHTLLAEEYTAEMTEFNSTWQRALKAIGIEPTDGSLGPELGLRIET